MGVRRGVPTRGGGVELLDTVSAMSRSDPDRIVQMAASAAAGRVRQEVERAEGRGGP
jgi:hypothetical protein